VFLSFFVDRLRKTQLFKRNLLNMIIIEEILINLKNNKIKILLLRVVVATVKITQKVYFSWIRKKCSITFYTNIINKTKFIKAIQVWLVQFYLYSRFSIIRVSAQSVGKICITKIRIY